MDKIRIGIIGFGTVGSGTAKVLLDNEDFIKSRLGLKIEILKIAETDLEKRGNLMPSGIYVTRDPQELINDPEIQIIVEAIGGVETAGKLVGCALTEKKSVVTPNKELVAKTMPGLLQLAKWNNADLLFEAAVAGGIPIINPIGNDLYFSSGKILKIAGIINGTTNQILTEMSKMAELSLAINKIGMERRMKNALSLGFDDFLKEAQDAGFAERNPANDIEGKDSAYKISILASLASGSWVDPGTVYTEGITKISIRDLKYAKELGFEIKLLAVMEACGISMNVRVHPCLLRKDHPLAQINGANNAVMVKTKNREVTFGPGPGAGGMATGEAVVSDILRAAKNIRDGKQGSLTPKLIGKADITAIDTIITRFYLRLKVEDKPGILHGISAIFGQEGINIESVIQKDSLNGMAEVVIFTSPVRQNSFDRAMMLLKERIRNLKIENIIRII